MRILFHTICVLALAIASTVAEGGDSNDTFADATILPAGVLSATDNLTPGIVQTPDTVLGVRGPGGELTQLDDNSSIFGNGFASGVSGVLITDETISFSVSGVGDNDFTGAHSELGDFDVFVEVFDFQQNVLFSAFTDAATLAPGNIVTFNVPGDASWLGGTFNLNVDNTIGRPAGGDVDFYTFTGLTPGTAFRLSVDEQSLAVKSLAYRYDDVGAIIDTNLFSGATELLDFDGTVPASGELTFAVTGDGDFNTQLPGPDGGHDDGGTYGLVLALDTDIVGDFDFDGDVNDGDVATWRHYYASAPTADTDSDSDSDGRDFLRWQREATAAGLVAVSVPEPGGLTLACLLLLTATRRSAILGELRSVSAG